MTCYIEREPYCSYTHTEFLTWVNSILCVSACPNNDDRYDGITTMLEGMQLEFEPRWWCALMTFGSAGSDMEYFWLNHVMIPRCFGIIGLVRWWVIAFGILLFILKVLGQNSIYFMIYEVFVLIHADDPVWTCCSDRTMTSDSLWTQRGLSCHL